mmetsp:Transcript_122701/g.392897  ORF Transcript_122701/g.392897 Transcript_122701/m.392897 type:complete len:247 (+) Transcript_122701:648-1388(+)
MFRTHRSSQPSAILVRVPPQGSLPEGLPQLRGSVVWLHPENRVVVLLRRVGGPAHRAQAPSGEPRGGWVHPVSQVEVVTCLLISPGCDVQDATVHERGAVKRVELQGVGDVRASLVVAPSSLQSRSPSAEKCRREGNVPSTLVSIDGRSETAQGTREIKFSQSLSSSCLMRVRTAHLPQEMSTRRMADPLGTSPLDLAKQVASLRPPSHAEQRDPMHRGKIVWLLLENRLQQTCRIRNQLSPLSNW